MDAWQKLIEAAPWAAAMLGVVYIFLRASKEQTAGFLAQMKAQAESAQNLAKTFADSVTAQARSFSDATAAQAKEFSAAVTIQAKEFADSFAKNSEAIREISQTVAEHDARMAAHMQSGARKKAG